MKKKRYYLAYGSNLNLNQMAYRCPDAMPVGIGYIEGYELLFKGSKTGSYLTIEKRNGSKVPVAVWEVSEADEHRLDRYEGFPTFYYKKEMKFKYRGMQTGKFYERDAFVYIMHEDRKLGVPTDWYVSGCLDGYAAFGFDEKYLYSAVERSREGVAV